MERIDISNLAKIFRPVYNTFIGSKKNVDTNLPEIPKKRGFYRQIYRHSKKGDQDHDERI